MEGRLLQYCSAGILRFGLSPESMETYLKVLDFNVFQVDYFCLKSFLSSLFRNLFWKFGCGSSLWAIENSHLSIVDFGFYFYSLRILFRLCFGGSVWFFCREVDGEEDDGQPYKNIRKHCVWKLKIIM